MKNVWTQIKQSPEVIGFLLVLGTLLWNWLKEPKLEEQVTAYFLVLLLFCAWCFSKTRTAQTSELSEEQRAKLGEWWDREVKKATKDLAEYTALIGCGKDFREWNEKETEQFREYYLDSYLVFLRNLTLEFKKEDHRTNLKRRWECAEDQSVDIPSTKQLWEMGAAPKAAKTLGGETKFSR